MPLGQYHIAFWITSHIHIFIFQYLNVFFAEVNAMCGQNLMFEKVETIQMGNRSFTADFNHVFKFSLGLGNVDMKI